MSDTHLGRIRFEGSPWPAGHAIREFRWSGRLVPDSGAFFDLHLKTADYDAEGPGAQDEGAEGDWRAPLVWRNYHACTVSSTFWGEHRGFLVGTARSPFELGALLTKTFRVDTLPAGGEVPAFGMYLLGHDSVADHHVRFLRRHAVDTFHLSWRAKIALSYAGDEVYRHTFEANVRQARFEGFALPEGTTKKDAFALLRTYVKDPAAFVLLRRGEQRRFGVRALAR